MVSFPLSAMAVFCVAFGAPAVSVRITIAVVIGIAFVLGIAFLPMIPKKPLP
jgi:hypothetical protein